MRSKIDPESLLVWPDGSWCYKFDYDPVADQYKGDDYYILKPNEFVDAGEGTILVLKTMEYL